MPGRFAQTSGVPPRLLLLSLNYQPSDKVLAYLSQLDEAGVEVDLVLVDKTRLDDVELPAGVRVHPLMVNEKRHPVRRAEHVLVFSGPRRVITAARRITRRHKVGRPLDAVLRLTERGHRRVAKGFHRRVFVPIYRQARPWLLARAGRATVATLDVGSADRIVAADVSAVPLGWRLARQHQHVPATTALDLSPYEAPSGSA
ncbi:hypothetical protein ABT008_10140 [Micromonospora sp. NPDC002389]|uniref:hypothetical protein n=1 Tax=Micromonospora sp. NPDC002389 TaxID=3154272 RepID=UPI003316A845